MALDPYTELRKQPLRKYVTPSDFDQLKQFLTFDKQVSDVGTYVGLLISKCGACLLASYFAKMCVLKHYICNLTIWIHCYLFCFI